MWGHGKRKGEGKGKVGVIVKSGSMQNFPSGQVHREPQSSAPSSEIIKIWANVPIMAPREGSPREKEKNLTVRQHEQRQGWAGKTAPTLYSLLT